VSDPAPLSLLEYVSRQFGDDREQRFDFMTTSGEKVSGVFAAWPEPGDEIIVVTSNTDRLHVINVRYLVYISEHRQTEAREVISNIGEKVRDAGGRIGSR
jgi:hypothetical protein